ncbi:MAG: XRE family transcriptional regulator [Clostridia bacterium]|nr:XRE family transcriptional regulator [Clostridia bacterium]
MNRIKMLRKSTGTKQVDLCKFLGITQGALSGWENERYEPDIESIKKLAEFFNVSIDYLLGRAESNTIPFSYSEKDVLKIPVYGTIPAGVPMEAIEDILDYEEVPESWSNGGKEFFGLKIKGDSMEPEYRNGDIVIFLKQNDCENNEDCAVAVNGNDWTFKRVEKLSNGILVKPLNPSYETKFYTNQECEELPVEVKGVFWELRRSKRK